MPPYRSQKELIKDEALLAFKLCDNNGNDVLEKMELYEFMCALGATACFQSVALSTSAGLTPDQSHFDKLEEGLDFDAACKKYHEIWEESKPDVPARLVAGLGE